MAPYTDNSPKGLLPVHDKPILWYILRTLMHHGLKRVIFPLGYKGELIQRYVVEEFGSTNLEFEFVDTGVDTLIKHRIDKIKSLVNENTDIFLLNSDTIFNFDVGSMYDLHRKNKSLVTMASVEITSAWGLVLEQGNELRKFCRERRVAYLISDNDENSKGFIYSGISFINSTGLEMIDLNSSVDFEELMFNHAIEIGRASRYPIEGSWFAIDTPKDLMTINALSYEEVTPVI
jgi:NDP-sugar pyrophosphorylase family protein